MSERHAASAEPGGPGRPRQPAGGGGDDEWPDDLWPGDDPSDQPAAPEGGSSRDGAAGQGWPWPPMPPVAPQRRRLRPAVLVPVGLAAAAAGAGIALAAHALAAAPAVPAQASQPPYQVPGLPGGGHGQPGGNGAPPGGSAGATIMLVGRVTAVSSTSITIGRQAQGNGDAGGITAAVTSSTKITGEVSGIGGIKAGDEVSAQITKSGSRFTAIGIQDPAQSSVSGGLP